MPKVGLQPIRKRELIEATFEVIERGGLEGVTVAAVAKAAGLSAGIVAHYFGNKDGLLEAAMRYLLRELSKAIADQRCQLAEDTPRSHLQAIISGTFDPSQTSPAAMRTWLSFWTASLNKPQLRRLQRMYEKRLHSKLTAQFARVLPSGQARSAATGLAALIDGLCLRGTLADGPFDVAQARALTRAYVDEQLDGTGRQQTESENRERV